MWDQMTGEEMRKLFTRKDPRLPADFEAVNFMYMNINAPRICGEQFRIAQRQG
jgi:hypothetical protein